MSAETICASHSGFVRIANPFAPSAR
jgi:hypothetical protein